MNSTPPQSGKPPTHHEKHDLPAIAGGMPVRSGENRIIFGAPLIGEAEAASVADCIRSGWIGLGERVGRFEQEFAAYKTCSVCGGCQQLQRRAAPVLEALGIGPGDEVIAPSLTFCSTVHAILHVECDAGSCRQRSGVEEHRTRRHRARDHAAHQGGHRSPHVWPQLRDGRDPRHRRPPPSQGRRRLRSRHRNHLSRP